MGCKRSGWLSPPPRGGWRGHGRDVDGAEKENEVAATGGVLRVAVAIGLECAKQTCCGGGMRKLLATATRSTPPAAPSIHVADSRHGHPLRRAAPPSRRGAGACTPPCAGPMPSWGTSMDGRGGGRWTGHAPTAPFHESLRVTVRLKTGAPGLESGSAAK